MTFDETVKYLHEHSPFTWDYQGDKTLAWEFRVSDADRSTTILILFNPDSRKLQQAIKDMAKYFAFFKQGKVKHD